MICVGKYRYVKQHQQHPTMQKMNDAKNVQTHHNVIRYEKLECE